MANGSFGEVKFWNDFTAAREAWVPTTTGDYLGGGVSLVGVNEGAVDFTADEPGGVIDLTTDTADNDNCALVAGVFKPADGGFFMECRFKITDSVATTRAAVFVGFCETLSLTTPVMPAETATTTTTYNGSGGMIGFLFDSDSTSLVFRFVAGDGGAAIATANAAGTAGGAIGITANTDTIQADKWYLVRVEVDENGKGRGYFGEANSAKEMVLVGKNTAALGTTDSFHAIAMIENRSGANERLEVDYFGGRGWRDWTP